MKAEAIYEVESGLKLSAFDISAASAVRTQWHHAVLRFFETYDAFVLPTAQVFPFDVGTMWPREIAGQAMGSYHEWMKCAVPATMAGSPALAAPAGFSAERAADGHTDRRAEPGRSGRAAARPRL